VLVINRRGEEGIEEVFSSITTSFDFEKMNEERYGVQDSMSTDMGTHTLRLSCSEGAGTSDEHRPEDDHNEDGVGHRGREVSCEPSTLGTRPNPVRLYRNVFDGNDRHVAGSSGEEPAASNRGDLRYQLMMQIMGMSVEDPALQSLQYFLAGAGRETGDTDTPTPTTEPQMTRRRAANRKRQPITSTERQRRA